jgi:SAM-dependent methyltransferase
MLHTRMAYGAGAFMPKRVNQIASSLPYGQKGPIEHACRERGPAMSEDDFLQLLAKTEHATVLELGTMRSVPDRPTHHRYWCHPSANFIMSDFEAGLDVDVVCDVHSLTDAFGKESIDFIICCSVFEHVQRPWIAAREIARVLKPGGIVFVQTHQTFPIHGYPSDFWRYTTEALMTIFEDVRLETLSATYRFPAQIVSEQIPDSGQFPAFLNANILTKKPVDWVDFAGAEAAGGMPSGGISGIAARRLNARIAELEAGLNACREELAQRDIELNSLRSSTSWRITAPGRALARLLLGRA